MKMTKFVSIVTLAAIGATAASADQRVVSCQKVTIPGTNATACASATITGVAWMPNESGADRNGGKAE